MGKQLYYSKIHLKNIEMYLAKLYIGMYEVHALANILSVNSNNGEHITNYVTCGSCCFCVTKAQGHQHLCDFF